MYCPDRLRNIALDLAESTFSIQENFFNPVCANAIRQEGLRLEEASLFKSAGIGHDQVFEVNKAIRSDKILWLDKQQDIPVFTDIFNFLEALKHALNRLLFLGITSLETHFAVYSKGAFYAPHRDRFKDQDTRQVSFVLYLNPNWQAGDGGELVLYDKQEHVSQIIEPKHNTLVCFLSDNLHEVKLSRAKRLSLTGWFLRRDVSNPLKDLT